MINSLKTALIFGITGQCGSYLAETMLDLGWKVYGVKRWASSLNTDRIDHLMNHPNLKLFYGDLADYASISNIISEIKPDYCVNLASQTHVRVSFDLPLPTSDITGIGNVRILEALRKFSPHTKFLHSSSSEMLGGNLPPQNENSLLKPCSIYGVAKVMAHLATINYREAYGMFAMNAISFNMESKRRNATFITRKASMAFSRIKEGLQEKVSLGNLKAARDWQHCKDVCDGMILMLHNNEPKDYCMASGEMRTIEELLNCVGSKLELDWKKYVEIDPRLFRACEVEQLCGDSSLIRKELGWKPKISFDMLIDEMLEHDLKLAKQEKLLKSLGG